MYVNRVPLFQDIEQVAVFDRDAAARDGGAGAIDLLACRRLSPGGAGLTQAIANKRHYDGGITQSVEKPLPENH